MFIIAYIIFGARSIYNKEYTDFDIRSLNYSDIDTGDILLLTYSEPKLFLTKVLFVHNSYTHHYVLEKVQISMFTNLEIISVKK